MQFRKFIPAVAACVLAVALSLALFLNASPQAFATELPGTEPADFNQSVSGVLYGADSAIYPYTCTMVINNVNNPNLGGEYEIVCCYMDLRNDQNVMQDDFGLIECYTEAQFYFPELDEYDEWIDYRDFPAWSDSQDPTFVGMGRLTVGEEEYSGYLDHITSVFMVDQQIIATLTWQREQ